MIKASPSRDAGSAERPRVLLADDHQAMLALTAEALAGECLVVGRVGDGCELLAEAEQVLDAGGLGYVVKARLACSYSSLSLATRGSNAGKGLPLRLALPAA